MSLKNVLLLLPVLFVCKQANATDKRKVGTKTGEFVFELQERTEEEMKSAEDKTQKYILILGQDSDLTKSDLLAIKSCLTDLEFDKSATFFEFYSNERYSSRISVQRFYC